MQRRTYRECEEAEGALRIGDGDRASARRSWLQAGGEEACGRQQQAQQQHAGIQRKGEDGPEKRRAGLDGRTDGKCLSAFFPFPGRSSPVLNYSPSGASAWTPGPFVMVNLRSPSFVGSRRRSSSFVGSRRRSSAFVGFRRCFSSVTVV